MSIHNITLPDDSSHSYKASSTTYEQPGMWQKIKSALRKLASRCCDLGPPKLVIVRHAAWMLFGFVDTDILQGEPYDFRRVDPCLTGLSEDA